MLTCNDILGLSLTACIVDAGTSNFEKAQVYVALSRVKTLSGLHLCDLDTRAMVVDTKVLHEYNRLRASGEQQLPPLPIDPQRVH